MKIILERTEEPPSLEEFADTHDLVMRVFQFGPKCFTARFDYAEVKEGSALVGVSGQGDTPQRAIKAYAEKIQGKLLVIRPPTPWDRKEVYFSDRRKTVREEITK